MPVNPGFLELLDQSLYDTVEIPPKLCHVCLFGNPIGSTVLTTRGPHIKHQNETNMTYSNVLEPPNRFIIERLGCLFFHQNNSIAITGDYKSRIWYTTILELYINMRWYWQGPAWRIADMAAVIGSTKAMEVLKQPDHNRLLDLLQPKLAEPLQIEQQQVFQARATVYDPLHVPVELFMYLQGRMARSVM